MNKIYKFGLGQSNLFCISRCSKGVFLGIKQYLDKDEYKLLAVHEEVPFILFLPNKGLQEMSSTYINSVESLLTNTLIFRVGEDILEVTLDIDQLGELLLEIDLRELDI